MFEKMSPDEEAGSEKKKTEDLEVGLSRRQFVKGALAAGASMAIPDLPAVAQEEIEKKETLLDRLPEFIKELNEKCASGEIENVFEKNSNTPSDVQSIMNNIFAITDYVEENDLNMRKELFDSIMLVINGFKEGSQESFDDGLKGTGEFFAKNGYLLNLTYLNGEEKELFIPGKYRERSGMVNNETLEKILPQEIVGINAKIIFISSESYPNQGGVEYGPVVINLSKITEAYDDSIKPILPDQEFWRDFSDTHFAGCILNNEMAHYALREKYNFSSVSEYDWDSFSKKENLKHPIKTSGEVDEFLSDAFSICTDTRFFIFKLRHIVIEALQKSEDISGDLEKNYAFSTSFSRELVEKILIDNKQGDFIEGLSEYALEEMRKSKELKEELKEKDDRVQNILNEKTKELAEKLDEKDLLMIKDEFAKMATVLVDEIRKNKK